MFIVSLFSLKFNIIFLTLTKIFVKKYIQDLGPHGSAFIFKAGSGSAFT
jgi:hypothetical protein